MIFSEKQVTGSPARIGGGKRILKEQLTFLDCKERIFGSDDPTKSLPIEKKGGKRIILQKR